MAKLTEFVLLQDGFEFRGERYGDQDIKHLAIDEIRTTVKSGFVTTGEVDSATLSIELNSGAKVELKSRSGFAPLALYFRDRPEERLAIRDAYKTLALRTFNMRAEPHLKQMQSKGYFEYGNCKFFKTGDVVLNGERMRLNEIDISRDYDFVFLNKRNPGFLAKVAKGWNGGPHFRLRHDQDVLFALLDHFFSIRW